MQINITIDEEFQENLSVAWLRQLVKYCLEVQELYNKVELGLLVTSDETVRDLNYRYRSIDETTDVLSFALSEEDKTDFITPPDEILHLGEVIISYPQAVRQAQTADHGVNQELALLVIHGVLHLLGYDHDEPEREKGMRIMEQELLRNVAQ